MHDYAINQISGLLRRTVTELGKTARVRDAESIHELRVSIRRLLQGLKTFAQYLPLEARYRVRDELRPVIKAAGAVRDCDVVLEMLADSGMVLDAVQRQRAELQRELLATIQPLLKVNPFKRWRTGLGIPGK